MNVVKPEDIGVSSENIIEYDSDWEIDEISEA